MNLIISVLFLTFSLKNLLGSKILFVQPTTSPSHLIPVEALIEELADRGHEISVFTLFPMKVSKNNVKHYKVKTSDKFEDEMHKMWLGYINQNSSKLSFFGTIISSLKIFIDAGTFTLEDPNFQRLKKEESFDLVVIHFFMQNFLIGIGEHFQCPTIMMSAGPAMSYSNLLIGNPLEINVVPYPFFMTKGTMSFVQKLKNLLAYGFDLIVQTYGNWLIQKAYELHFPSPNFIEYEDAIKNLSLILVNHHFAQNSVRPMVPAMIEVSGLQVKTKPSILPEYLGKWINESDYGVIFFSLGSNVKSKMIDQTKLEVLMKSFAKLKERVIFKGDPNDFSGTPENVLIEKWLPQNDILANPSTKLFISHCGLGSITEARYYGVPILGMPLFADQMGNLKVIVEEGWAIKVDFNKLNEQDFHKDLTEILINPKYSQTVKALSNLFKDRPKTAMETAVYWVEYVIRHKGAKHMRYSGADLNLFQRYSIDIYAFLIVSGYILMKSIKIIMKQILFRFKSKNKVKKN